MIKLVPRSKPFLPVAKKSVKAVYGNNGRVFRAIKESLYSFFILTLLEHEVTAGNKWGMFGEEVT
jgi:hypothetical protein